MDDGRTDDDEPTEDTADEPAEDTRPRWRRAGRTLLEWGGTLALIAVAWVGIGMLRAPDLPGQAPGFTLPDFSGQTVVLNFWATWCGPCRMEIPAFSDFATTHPEIPVLGIAVDGSAAELRRASESLGITYPVLIADGPTKASYGVETLPTTVIVGPDGAVRHAHAGLMLQPQLLWATR